MYIIPSSFSLSRVLNIHVHVHTYSSLPAMILHPKGVIPMHIYMCMVLVTTQKSLYLHTYMILFFTTTESLGQLNTIAEQQAKELASLKVNKLLYMYVGTTM